MSFGVRLWQERERERGRPTMLKASHRIINLQPLLGTLPDVTTDVDLFLWNIIACSFSNRILE